MKEITGYVHCAGCGLLIERSRGIDCHPQCESERPDSFVESQLARELLAPTEEDSD